MNIVKHICKIGLLTLVALPAWSATVSLSPSTQSIAAPELGEPAVFFQIDVMLDVADVAGSHPAIINGGYTITFDPSQVYAPVFVSGSLASSTIVVEAPITYLPPPSSPNQCGGSPACVVVGLLANVLELNAPEQSALGSWSFEVKDGVTQGTSIHIGVDNAQLFGDQVSISNFGNTACDPGVTDCGIALFDPDYSGATVNVVPIPASVWLFGSALGALGWARRRKVVPAE
jgi:hypothetical protein